MKTDQGFPRQMIGLVSREFGSMRHRISAAILPHTCRKLSRNHCRIHSLNKKGCKPFFTTAMTCDMSRNNRLSQGFLMTLSNRGVA
jgi:hypothetical protein